MGHPMSEAALPRDSYSRQWIITIALVVVGIGAYAYLSRARTSLSFPTVQAEHKQADWFMVLRMPAITSQHESGIDTMKTRYAQWLDTLTRAGYHPVIFSDVRRALIEGTKLPEKSVVLLFDPGWRRTHQIIEPILRTHRWKGVWLSDGPAMENRHREFITYRTAELMVESGLWDVGVKSSKGIYDFSIRQKNNFKLGNEANDAWARSSGGLALNQVGPLQNMNRLNVHADWLADDLLNRLNAEIPITQPSYLTVGSVQNLFWGVAQEKPTTFNLAMRPGRKDLVISWLGTQGRDNCQMTVSIPSVAGVLAFRFRWDEVRGDGVQLRVSRDSIVVEEWADGHPNLLLQEYRATSNKINATILLAGKRMAIVLGGATYSIPNLQSAGNERGVTQIYLSDRIRDVAKVSNAEILYEPLPKAVVAWPTPITR
jgi:hypothetical protein